MKEEKNADSQTEEELLLDGLIFALWEKYWDEMDKNKSKNNKAYKDIKAQVKRFSSCYGVSEDSPLACMYQCFLAGVDKGLELAMTIDSMKA